MKKMLERNAEEKKTAVVFREKDWYRGKIVEMVEHIKDKNVLIKIYTVVKTHSEILNEKKGG